MAQWTFIDPNTLLPGDPWTSAKAQAAFENLEAVAEGAAGAPRVAPEALNLRVAEVDPAGMAEVVFTDLEPSGFSLDFETVQPDSTANRVLRFAASYDNGITFSSDFSISMSTNWRNTVDDRLVGLSGFATASNMMVQSITFAPTSSRMMRDMRVGPDPSLDVSNDNLHQVKPFSPVNAVSVFWSTGTFGSDDNQRIRLYQDGRRPFGAKP